MRTPDGATARTTSPPPSPCGHRGAHRRLVVPRRRAADDRLQPGRLGRGGGGSGARIEDGQREGLGPQQPGRGRAQRRRIDRLQALAVATIVVVVVRDGGGETEPPRPPLDAVGGAAEIALQEAPDAAELVGRDLVAREPQRLVDGALGGRLDPLGRGRQHQLEQRGAARPKGQPVHGGDDLPVVDELAGQARLAAAGQQRRDQIRARPASSGRGAATRNPSAT